MTTVESAGVGLDRYDASVAVGASGGLRAFNEAGILAASDVHVARRLAQLAGAGGDDVGLGIAFAARAPRLGHVCVDLRTIRLTASGDLDLPTDIDALPWPDPGAWLDAMARSPLVGEGKPLHLAGSNLYLNRLWLDECEVAHELLARAGTEEVDVDVALLRAGLRQLFGEDDPRRATRTTCSHWPPRPPFCAGSRSSPAGPGRGRPRRWRACWGCSTQQAVAHGAGRLSSPWPRRRGRRRCGSRRPSATRPPGGLDPGIVERLLALRGNDAAPAARAQRRQPDPVPAQQVEPAPPRRRRRRRDLHGALSMMARLLEAVRPDARLILVGDPEQLASVEAGAVLGDIVGPASRGLCMGRAARKRLAAVTGYPVPATATARAGSPIGDGVVVLRHVRRHKGAIAALRPGGPGGRAGHALAELARGDSNVAGWRSTRPAPRRRGSST